MDGLVETLEGKPTVIHVDIIKTVVDSTQAGYPTRLRTEIEDAIEVINHFLLAPLFGAHISTKVLDYRLRDLLSIISPNGHAKPEDKPPKVPSREDLVGYPLVTRPTSDNYTKRRSLERGLQLVHVLSGDKYNLLTRKELPLRTGDEIFFRGYSVAIVNPEKMSASLRYEKLQDPSKVLLEQALINAGFSINGDYERKLTTISTRNHKL